MEEREQHGAVAPIFLSYSREDQAAVLPLIAALESAGIEVWWDGLIEGGAKFGAITEQALEDASAVVVLWSKTSVGSHWVKDEATLGRDRQRLVPVSIDGSEPPLGFRQFQCLDLPPAAMKPGHPQFDRLINSIKRLQDGGYVMLAASRSLTARTLPRRAVLVGTGITIAGIAGIATWMSGASLSGARANSIAILPFLTLGAENGEQDYFADGLATEIRARLARNPLLKVSAQASSHAARESGNDEATICRELGVAFMLDGTVRRSEDRVRVLAELIEGATGDRLWSDEFDQPVDAIFEIERAISTAITRSLTSQANDKSAEQLGGTESITAYDAYLQGLDLYNAGTDEDSDRLALVKFDQAIAVDPKYAAAHAARSRALGIIGNLYGSPVERASLYRQAVISANKAVTIAPSFAEGHSALGFALAMGELNMANAREPYQRSFELGAGDADVLSRYAIFQSRMSNYTIAEKAIGLSTALDPLNARTFRFAGEIAYFAGNYSQALASYTKAKSIQDSLSSYHYLVGLVQLATGDLVGAKQSFAKESRSVWKYTGSAIADYRLGNQTAAEDHLTVLKNEQGDSSSYQYAQIYAQWGRAEDALAALTASWGLRDSGLVQMNNDPLLEPIRSKPVFQNLLKKIGFAN